MKFIRNILDTYAALRADSHNVQLWNGEFFEYELNLRERLDAMIVRQVKHLIQTKAMKQMLRQVPAEDSPTDDVTTATSHPTQVAPER